VETPIILDSTALHRGYLLASYSQQRSARMKTTLDLPNELMEEAMQLTDIKTKTEVIIVALQELIKKNKVAELMAYKGKINLDMDMDLLRNRNAHSG